MEETELNEKTPVPLKWIFGLCSIIITCAMLYVSSLVSDIRAEISLMRESVGKLNVSVAVLLNDQNYSKSAIEDLQKRVSGLEQNKRH